MMKFILKILCLLVLSCTVYDTFAQKENGQKIDLIHADVGEGIVDSVAIWKGTVHFSQGDVHLYCDSAYQYNKSNRIEAFGNVRLIQGDTITLNSDKLNYDGNKKMALATGNVVLRDRKMTLVTDALNYDVQNKVVLYTNGGKINDNENKLSSKEGSYSTESKIFRFKKDVHLHNTVKNYTLDSDTLEYNSFSKIATFRGPTAIKSPDGNLNADEGEYNTLSGVMTFNGRSRVVYGSNILEAKSIWFDEKNNVGIVQGDVRITSTKDSLLIEGDEARYWGQRGTSKVWGNAVMKSFNDKDTLFLSADTLLSVEDKKLKKNNLYAYKNAKIFRSDFQGKCDSLLYNFADSTIKFVGDPLLWNGKNQIEADSIRILLAKSKISKMYTRMNSFIVSRDSMMNFNQVKGRDMTAFFNDNKIETVYVDGNGESVYFAIEGDKKLIGMNKVLCSNMIIRFQNNTLNSISFVKNPEAKFIPPHEINEQDKKLKGFTWRLSERPSKEDVTRRNKVK